MFLETAVLGDGRGYALVADGLQKAIDAVRLEGVDEIFVEGRGEYHRARQARPPQDFKRQAVAKLDIEKQQIRRGIPLQPLDHFYQSLAEKVSLTGCIDPAFLRLQATLQGWFPPKPPQP